MQNKTKLFLMAVAVLLGGVFIVDIVSAEPTVPWCCSNSAKKICNDINSSVDACPEGFDLKSVACSTISTCPQYLGSTSKDNCSSGTCLLGSLCMKTGQGTCANSKNVCCLDNGGGGGNSGGGSGNSGGTGVIIPDKLAGLPTNPNLVKGIFTNVANFLLSIIGILAIIGFVISGIQYYLVATDEKMLETAKKTMVASIIGLVVALFGYIAVKTVEMLLKG